MMFKGKPTKPEYLEKLKSKDANTFLSDKEAKEFEKELQKRVDSIKF